MTKSVNDQEVEMAIDTFIVYVGVYADLDAAEEDYELVKDLHRKAGLIDAYDAAIIQRRDDNKVKIVKKHETPTRVGGVLGGGVGLATDTGQAGLVVVAVSDMEAKVEKEMRRADKIQKKQLKADVEAHRA